MPPRARLHFLCGDPGRERFRELEALLETLETEQKTVVILEGLDGGDSPSRENLIFHRLAPGCLCCIGWLALSVTLTRSLRLERPDNVVVGLADCSHLIRIQQTLATHPFDQWLVAA